MLTTHLKRAIDWNVSEVVITPSERRQLEAAGVHEPRMQGLLAWRRSTLLVAIPVLLLSLALSVQQVVDAGSDGFTGVGQVWRWLPSLGLAMVPIGGFMAIKRWTELRSSSKTLIGAWVASIVLPLVAALIPLDAIIDLDSLRNSALSETELREIDGLIFGLRVAIAVTYAMTLLPTVLSVPGGVLKGAARVKSLFPAAVLPGWFLVAVAPFYSMFMVVVFVLIAQIVGNMLLVLGVGLLAFAPWLYVIHRKTYGRAMSMEESRTELAKASRLGGFVTAAGLACVLLFAFTAKVGQQDVLGGDAERAVFTYVQLGRTLLEVVSRGFATAVVFCLIFLSMIYNDWRTTATIPVDIRREHDAEMLALQRHAKDLSKYPSSDR